jgi:hypothetical protein
METQQFGISCPGNGCPVKQTAHAHMQPQPSESPNPRLKITDSTSIAVIAEILGNKELGIVGSYDGLTETQRSLERFESEFGALGVSSSVVVEVSCV